MIISVTVSVDTSQMVDPANFVGEVSAAVSQQLMRVPGVITVNVTEVSAAKDSAEEDPLTYPVEPVENPEDPDV